MGGREVLRIVVLGGALLLGMTAIPVKAAPAKVIPGGSETSIQGILRVAHSDNFATGGTQDWYYLDTARGRVQLDAVGRGLEGLSGSEISLRGSRFGSRFSVASTRNVRVIKSRAVTAPGIKKTAVILINFQNDKSMPVSVDDMRSTVFTGPRSVNQFYNENSFGGTSLAGKVRSDGDVFGWYTVPDSSVTCDFGKDVLKWAKDADSAAAAAGHDLTGYDEKIYYFPRQPSCQFAGIAWIGAPGAWINGSNYTGTIGHEVGHNFGAAHASGYECFNASKALVPLSSDCQYNGDTYAHPALEYADPYDIMGMSWTGPFQMSAFHKTQLGFLPFASTLTVTTPGTYTIVPSELGGAGITSLRIPNPKSRDAHNAQDFFYLDFRQPMGTFDFFDPSKSLAGGVMVRLGTDYVADPNNPWNVRQSWLINAHPRLDSNGNENFSGAAFGVGETFLDPATNVSARVTSISSQGATVDVRFDGPPAPCTSSRPSATLAPVTGSLEGMRSTGKDYSLTVSDNDSSTCSAANFSLRSTLPYGWKQSSTPLSMPSFSLSPGGTLTFSLHLTPPAKGPKMSYAFKEQVTNTKKPALTVIAQSSYKVIG